MSLLHLCSSYPIYQLTDFSKVEGVGSGEGGREGGWGEGGREKGGRERGKREGGRGEGGREGEGREGGSEGGREEDRAVEEDGKGIYLVAQQHKPNTVSTEHTVYVGTDTHKPIQLFHI